jgi:hypothetical protein
MSHAAWYSGIHACQFKLTSLQVDASFALVYASALQMEVDLRVSALFEAGLVKFSPIPLLLA